MVMNGCIIVLLSDFSELRAFCLISDGSLKSRTKVEGIVIDFFLSMKMQLVSELLIPCCIQYHTQIMIK